MRLALTTAFALLPVLAAAQEDPVDRIAAANIAMAEQMEAFFLSRAPELEDRMPDHSWNDEMRAAGECFVAGYEEEQGKEGLDAYITAMETWSETEITSFEQMNFGMPEILTDPLPQRLSQECGVIEISVRRAQESGFIEALSDPEIMGRVMAE